MYAPLVQNDCQLFHCHENIDFSMIFKETTTRTFYEYRTDRLDVGSTSRKPKDAISTKVFYFFTL